MVRAHIAHYLPGGPRGGGPPLNIGGGPPRPPLNIPGGGPNPLPRNLGGGPSLGPRPGPPGGGPDHRGGPFLNFNFAVLYSFIIT